MKTFSIRVVLVAWIHDKKLKATPRHEKLQSVCLAAAVELPVVVK